MQPEYQIDHPEAIPSPALVFFKDIIARNLNVVIGMAGSATKLRPHVKTHKCAEIVRMELDAGILKHKCATIAEAEMLARAGVTDTLIAYPIVGPNIERLAQLMLAYPTVAFKCLVDCKASADALGTCMMKHGLVLETMIDLDVGMHRTGIPIGDDAVALYEKLADTPGLKPGGLHAYDGHNNEPDFIKRQATVDAMLVPLLVMQNMLEQKGRSVPRITCGGTPSFSVFARMNFPGLECSPGTFILHDQGYGAKFSDLAPLTPAALLLTRVVSTPTGKRITLDLGYKAVASDPPAGKRVHLLDMPAYTAVMQSEEHYTIECAEAAKYHPGDVIYAVPTHVCPTCSMHQQAYVIEGGKLIGTWRIAARDRVLSV